MPIHKRAKVVSVAVVLFLGGAACGLLYSRWRWSGVRTRRKDAIYHGLSEEDLNRALVQRLLRKQNWTLGGMRIYRGLNDDAQAAFKALGEIVVNGVRLR